MEIYNETGKTKSGELRITRPIGALLVGMSQPFSALTNETITAFIERANGNNTEIFTELPLAAFIAASTAGNPAVFENDTDLRALCELSEEGSINLQETESIKIKLDGLKSAVTYFLNGIEYPTSADSAVKITRKNLLSGETDRRFDVSGEELMLIDGVDSIIELSASFENGMTCRYTAEELKALSRDFDPVKVVHIGTAPAVGYDLTGFVTMPLVGVNSIDIKKQDAAAVRLFLKNDVEKY